MRRTAVPEEFKTVDGVTPPQLKFICDLLAERDLRKGGKIVVSTDEEYAAAIDRLKEQASRLSKRDASLWLDKLQTLPHLPRDRAVRRGGATESIPSAEELPSGHYAIENNDGELRFYRVWRGDRNPNYVKLYVEHGPDSSEVPFRSALSIIAKIVEAGTFNAARRYGAEIGRCSRCNARLTNRVSRLLSIGPICGGRFWSDEGEWKSRVSRARASLRDAGLDPSGTVAKSDNFDYAQEIN